VLLWADEDVLDSLQLCVAHDASGRWHGAAEVVGVESPQHLGGAGSGSQLLWQCEVPRGHVVVLPALSLGTAFVALQRRATVSSQWATVGAGSIVVTLHPGVHVDSATRVDAGAVLRWQVTVTRALLQSARIVVRVCVDTALGMDVEVMPGVAQLEELAAGGAGVDVLTLYPPPLTLSLPDADTHVLDLVVLDSELGVPVAHNVSYDVGLRDGDVAAVLRSEGASVAAGLYAPRVADTAESDESPLTMLDVLRLHEWCWEHPGALGLVPLLEPYVRAAAACVQSRLLAAHSFHDLSLLSHFLVNLGEYSRASTFVRVALQPALQHIAALRRAELPLFGGNGSDGNVSAGAGVATDVDVDDVQLVDACTAVVNHAVALHQMGSKSGEAEAAVGWFTVAALHLRCPTALLSAAKIHEGDGNVQLSRQLYLRHLESVDSNPLVFVHQSTMSAAVLMSQDEVDSEYARIMGAIAAITAPEFRFARTVEWHDSAALDTGSMAYHAIYMGKDDRALREGLVRVYRKVVTGLDFVAPHVAAVLDSPDALAAWALDVQSRPLRVGFVSSLFMDHTQGLLMSGVMQNLNPARFQSHIFFMGRGPATEVHLPHLHTHTLPRGSSLREVRAAVLQQQLDVLVFNDVSMDPSSYFLAFSRVAHVQCLTLNNGITSGLSDASMDFYISSALHQQPGAQEQYSEELLLLPGSHTFYFRAGQTHALPRTVIGLPPHSWREGGAVLLVCLQALMKLHVALDDSVVDIVLSRGVGAVRVVFIATGRNNHIRLLLLRLGRNAERRYGVPVATFVAKCVTVLRWMHREMFNSLIAHADVMLDSYPFGGGATSLQAFELGVPVLTLPSAIRSGSVRRSAAVSMRACRDNRPCARLLSSCAGG
jgi:hypothetical protein